MQLICIKAGGAEAGTFIFHGLNGFAQVLLRSSSDGYQDHDPDNCCH